MGMEVVVGRGSNTVARSVAGVSQWLPMKLVQRVFDGNKACILLRTLFESYPFNDDILQPFIPDLPGWTIGEKSKHN